MKRTARLMGALSILALAGCASTSPNWDTRFGDAARVAAAEQVIAPEASKNADSVAGIDGKAAQGAMGEYAKSFTRPEPQKNVFSIGVGAAQ
ncbi:pilus assembly protein [Aromatoleum aromaticum]|uniref:pilus assembly protein n=1 Tax=Aromatoleum aromaticum TaxID=551760 RepID=UPI0014592E35|nr:pilus assembly protein [Aromatoleum aromaticum]NMG56794.1 pilus assembly protein [Aromatoleum aromaticum]